MRLYTTIQSERGTIKGLGGDKFISIRLQGYNQQDIAKMVITQEQDRYLLIIDGKKTIVLESK